MNKFMRLFALLLVAVAIVLVVLAFKFGGDETPPRTASNPAPVAPSSGTDRQATYAVVTAAAALPPGTPITADDLKVEQRTQRVANGYDSVDAVVGKIPAVPIAAGATLTRHLMLDDISLKLAPGERAMAIPVTAVTGVGHHIHPGDYVDVFFSLKPRSGSDDWKKIQARLLMPRLRVLAYGSRRLPEPAQAASSKQPSDTSRSRPSTAVLAVPLDKVNRLLLAEQQGKLALVLRNPKDPGMPDTKRFPQPGPVLIAEVDTSADPPGDAPEDANKADNQAYAGIRLGGLATGDKAPKPRARPRRHRAPAHHRVDVIRGTQRSHITVYDHQGTMP